MKKLILIAVAVILLGGCAHMQEPTKTRQDNTIASKGYPAANIKVNSNFSYVDMTSEYLSVVTDAQTTSNSSIDSQKFIFGKTMSGKIGTLAVIRFMQMQKSGWQFLRESEWSGSGIIYSKVNTAMGELEAYSGITQADDFVQWVAPGVTLSSHEACVAAVIFRQIPRAMARYKFHLTYAEFMPCDNIHQFYYDDMTPTRTAKLRLERVRRNALKDITIISTQ